jgi:hypothetical protein
MIYNASFHLFGGEFNEERQKHERSRVGCVINVQKDSAMGEKRIHQDYVAIVFLLQFETLPMLLQNDSPLVLVQHGCYAHLKFVFTIEHDSCDLMNFCQSKNVQVL